MALQIGVPAETATGERRVALVPDVVKRLTQQGMSVRVEKGAGTGAFITDAEFEAAGAQIVTREEAWASDLVVHVQPPSEAEIALLRSGSVYIGFLSPLDHPEIVEKLARQGVTALAMELVPRISRAQKMDALSAMAAVAGYKAVLIAANLLPKFFPLLTTAAGTVRPASVLVLGAGVAGLQAIATARRLGARVSAYDIRDAVKEEVQSLGATFLELPFEVPDAQDVSGYAKALAEEKQRQQAQLLVPHIGRSDVVISTAQVPGRRAPVLITEEAVAAMQPGTVIIDLAAPSGGNCVLTKPGETVVHNGVQIVGPLNLPAEMPVHASQMYARTLLAMIQKFTTPEGFKPDFEDEIFKGACVTYNGEVVNERVRALLAA
ncbi:Re/Si-specific NAD(P)(+) transhydrogenase subunit alpha [Rhodothermus marinus]|uniref:Re/Si-specific NAD(P)(+) transhydrogenase subunit alpha n=1 Tax=Rhodothermus marinus TaxID=29549 RepID=UPI0012BA3EC8|nr:Re/Si-specific NAD(P)(+) transhydrogenase subunit alpha [Rhodothermus marinus]BBM70485.1 NAD(P) transhydrogenase subunit alpha [Rhodothermus marinus]BBM73472.1 NAD(P) transhydrogenase subunit alpha [Rhodothermus marinus]